jgi:hypothetical protein
MTVDLQAPIAACFTADKGDSEAVSRSFLRVLLRALGAWAV